MNSEFISQSRTPEILESSISHQLISQRPRAAHADAAMLDLPPAPRQRPNLGPERGAEVPSQASRLVLLGQERVGKAPTKRTQPVKAKPSQRPPAFTRNTSNHWNIEAWEVRAIEGEVGDNELESWDYQPGDWESPGMRIRRIVREFFSHGGQRRPE